jgi:hypothetical protein
MLAQAKQRKTPEGLARTFPGQNFQHTGDGRPGGNGPTWCNIYATAARVHQYGSFFGVGIWAKSIRA